MKILIFHPVRLPPKNYGGTERVVLWLSKGLKEMGHDVWVAASAGSALPDGVQLIGMEKEKNSLLDLLSRLPDGLDVIHFMAPPEEKILNHLPCPSLLTVHGNGELGEEFIRNSVFLSQDHAKRHHAEVFVYNGIDPAEYLFTPAEKKNWYLFFSKTNWRVKNLSGAIRLCTQESVPLCIAGGNRPVWTRLMTLVKKNMVWKGPLSGVDKALLFAQAKALIFPVCWPEPFGLVVAEALMSGTPVLATRRGSLSELVSQNVGMLFDSDRDERWSDYLCMTQLPWDPYACRERAMSCFHYKKMAEQYLQLYRRISSGENLHTKAPKAGDWRRE